MNIVIIGNDASFREAKQKFGEQHHLDFQNQQMIDTNTLDKADVVFDFNTNWTIETLTPYISPHTTPIFLNTVFTTLSSMMAMANLSESVFGFCGLATFFNRTHLELTTVNKAAKEKIIPVMEELETEYTMVKDQVGMITPRVIAMIINEAYETLQQGVASRKDIDLSMKLGTNYPFGPFEWGDRIGLENVKQLLEKLEGSSGDSRYHPNF